MKFKQIVTLLFLLSFAIYNLCPLLMQGNCGFSLPDSVPIAESSQHCHKEVAPPRLDWDLNKGVAGLFAACCIPTTGCEKEDSNTPRQENRNAENCCFIGLELLNPSKSDPLDQLLITALSLVAAIPSPIQAPFLSELALRHVHPARHHYDYFPVHQISLRGPPLFLS